MGKLSLLLLLIQPWIISPAVLLSYVMFKIILDYLDSSYICATTHTCRTCMCSALLSVLMVPALHACVRVRVAGPKIDIFGPGPALDFSRNGLRNVPRYSWREKNLVEVETRTFDFFNTRDSLDLSDWKKYLLLTASLIPRHQNGVNFRVAYDTFAAATCAHIISSLRSVRVKNYR